MSGSMNLVILVGNVCADPDIRSTQDGKKIVTFTVATNERWKDKNSGEWKERAEFNRCVCFNDGLSHVLEGYVRKGSKVALRGQLQTRKWQDQDGRDRYTTEVVMSGFNAELTLLDSKPKRGGDGEEAALDAEAREAELSQFDDEIPF